MHYPYLHSHPNALYDVHTHKFTSITGLDSADNMSLNVVVIINPLNPELNPIRWHY